MGLTRILKLSVQTFLVALAVCLLPSLGKAQSAYRGTFTLPFTAHWGTAVLQAGDYSINMESATAPYVLYVRGAKNTLIVLASGADTTPLSKQSQLVVVNTEGDHRITSFEASQLGITLDYALPKSRMHPMASAKGAKTKGSVSEVILPLREASDSAAAL